MYMYRYSIYQFTRTIDTGVMYMYIYTDIPLDRIRPLADPTSRNFAGRTASACRKLASRSIYAMPDSPIKSSKHTSVTAADREGRNLGWIRGGDPWKGTGFEAQQSFVRSSFERRGYERPGFGHQEFGRQQHDGADMRYEDAWHSGHAPREYQQGVSPLSRSITWDGTEPIGSSSSPMPPVWDRPLHAGGSPARQPRPVIGAGRWETESSRVGTPLHSRRTPPQSDDRNQAAGSWVEQSVSNAFEIRRPRYPPAGFARAHTAQNHLARMLSMQAPRFAVRAEP